MSLTKFITEVSCPVCGEKLHFGQISRTGSKRETLTFKPLPKYDCLSCGAGLRLVERYYSFFRLLFLLGAVMAFFTSTMILLVISGYPGGGAIGFVLALISLLLIVLTMFNFKFLMTNWFYKVEVVE